MNRIQGVRTQFLLAVPVNTT